jgi:hypothetical protein
MTGISQTSLPGPQAWPQQGHGRAEQATFAPLRDRPHGRH